MICIVDTSILCELLAVPGRSQTSATVAREFEAKVKGGETLVLPLVVLFETGNHIGQVQNGSARRRVAESFVELCRRAVADETPFRLAPAPSAADVGRLLSSFTEWATQGSGFGDLSIKDVWSRQCELHQHRRVYIWSRDSHLLSFDQVPE